MTSSQRIQALLTELAEVRSRPITDPALAARVRTEATSWINAAHMQYQRASQPVVDPVAPGDEGWRQEIDLQFLLVA